MTEIFLVFLIFGLLGAVMVVVNKILGPKRSHPTKNKPFECGSPYLQEEIRPVPIKYYIVAFLFLLFDIEVVFFFPWALIFKEMGISALVFMFVYIFLLIIGFIYAWKKGAFNWEE
ncbi:MAG: NADH-quinone oxidoreductase subunit A [Candidatus Aminicenantaceae bacterium]